MVARGCPMRVVHEYWLVLLALMIGAVLIRGALTPM